MASRTRSDRGDPPAAPEPKGAEAGAASDETVTQPRLGPLGYLRFFWRQLTSMRTALILLLLLALAAVPGSLVPQRSSDPNGVIQYQQQHPDWFPVLDGLGLFSTFSAPWFSAIYILLFISLIGCIIPRTKHHFDALRARPPKTPVRLQRLVGYRSEPTARDAETAIVEARALLKRLGYRTERYGLSVSAERGYLRETGNLLFHVALVGMLLVVGFFGGFGYTGQRVLVEGQPFTNVLSAYDSFTQGRFFAESQLDPFSLRLDSFQSAYTIDPLTSQYHATDFTANLSSRTSPTGAWTAQPLKVNSPISAGGTLVYLLGNGFAPVITVRDPKGTVVFSQAVPYVSPDANLASLGIIKVPDGLAQQVGIQSGIYPDPVKNADGTYSSLSPNASAKTLITMRVYTGDLGLNNGTAVNVYSLNTDNLTQVAGGKAATPTLELTQGQTVQLPNGLGSVEFTSLKRYVSVDIHHDPTPGWALAMAVLILGGLLLSLFVPRRRLWIKAVPGDGPDAGVRLEYAGLARGEDPTLADAVADLAQRHRTLLGDLDPNRPPNRGPAG